MIYAENQVFSYSVKLEPCTLAKLSTSLNKIIHKLICLKETNALAYYPMFIIIKFLIPSLTFSDLLFLLFYS
jgi:hypothetical protein